QGARRPLHPLPAHRALPRRRRTAQRTIPRRRRGVRIRSTVPVGEFPGGSLGETPGKREPQTPGTRNLRGPVGTLVQGRPMPDSRISCRICPRTDTEWAAVLKAHGIPASTPNLRRRPEMHYDVPYDDLDGNVRELVRELNRFPDLHTV